MTPSRATYLDWNAGAPLRPEAAAAIAAALTRFGNPSSVHRVGRAARQVIEAARVEVALLAGAAPADVVFTSGGTEANHLALCGFPDRRIIVSAIEHDCVRQAVREAEVLPVLPTGCVDLAALEDLLAADPRPACVALMLANNETGAIQPVAEAAQIAHRHGAFLHCDAVQAAGKLQVDRAALGADTLALSAHKIGGPAGIGALVLAPGLQLTPTLPGGGQERGRRAGTENLLGIVGFGAAAQAARRGIADHRAVASLRDNAESRLLAIAPAARVFAATVPRLANTLCIAMPDTAAVTQIMALDLAGVMVSAGAACSSGKVKRSHVLAAMGVPPEAADNAIRISLGWSTQAADIDHLVEAWGRLYARSRESAA
jgi:cysteine desulfurase